MDTGDVFAERIFKAAVAAFDLYGIYLGDRLGLYRVLADRGPSTSAELAEAAGINARYAREWLEHQAASGILAVGEDWRFNLPPAHDEVLLDETSLSFFASLAQSAVACVRPIVEATREWIRQTQHSVQGVSATRNWIGVASGWARGVRVSQLGVSR